MISVVNDMLEMLTAPYPKIRCSACIFIIIIICYNVLYLEFNHIMGRKMADAWNCFDINFKIMENTMCLSKLKDISMRVPWPLSGYRGTPFLSFSVTFLKPDNVCDSLFAVFDDDFLRAKKKKADDKIYVCKTSINVFFPIFIILRVQRLEGKQCRSR